MYNKIHKYCCTAAGNQKHYRYKYKLCTELQDQLATQENEKEEENEEKEENEEQEEKEEKEEKEAGTFESKQ